MNKKFRIWNGKAKAFIENANDAIVYMSFMDIARYFNDCVTIPEYYTFQQWSGLKDNNNKDIYEGDILKLHKKINRPGDWWEKQQQEVDNINKTDKIGEVYFGSGAFMVKNIDCLWCNVKDGVCCDYEVIGNIFENKDLLGID